MTEEHINYMLSKIPRNKFAKVEELASLVTWLSSEENSFSTAAVFDLSGGRATYILIMQIGIDVGATKIESVVLEKDGQEKHRSRIACPKNYTQIITSIRDIHRQLEQEFKQELQIGVCHPGVHSPPNRIG